MELHITNRSHSGLYWFTHISL